MKLTFGICTSGQCPDMLEKVIRSIRDMDIPKDDYEIIIISSAIAEDIQPQIIEGNIVIYGFNEKEGRPPWISRKKNLITKYAKFDVIVYLHDYIIFDKNWYSYINQFSQNEVFDVAMNEIQNLDGSRFRDWMQWHGTLDNGRWELLDYSTTDKIKNMGISGSYWMASKQFMQDNPLDESRGWGQSEDVEHSLRCRQIWNYKFVPLAKVRFLKYKMRHC